MMIKSLLSALLALVSVGAVASPIAGTWQGPCEVRGELSVMFTYVFSEVNEAGEGSLAKTKIYYNDDACTVYNRTGRATVWYRIGELNEDGHYPLDVNHRGTMFYDIVALSDDGEVMSFGETDSRDPAVRPRTLSTTDRVFVRAE